ncbi:MAG: response regulator [Desulfobacterales bacterium]
MKKNDAAGSAGILVVDDEESICRLLSDILEFDGYHCLTANDSEAARAVLKSHTVDLVLSDINMPGESGLDFIQFVFDNYPDIAVIMVTAMDDTSLAGQLFELGVYDYITKPITRSGVLISVSNALTRRSLEITNRSYRDGLEKMVEERTKSIQNIMEKLRQTLDGMIHTIALTVETRDPYTAGHQRRVADLARAIAVEMELSDEVVEGSYLAGLIHDLGKISIPAEILSKPGLLSKNEFNLIKEHPRIGYEILQDIEFPWPIADIVLQHHERFDGSGYPQGLKGDDILLQARIIAVADVVEAVASHRPYRAALGIDIAMDEIRQNAGTFYDPKITKVCMDLFKNKGYRF